jgi:hypothetical protein
MRALALTIALAALLLSGCSVAEFRDALVSWQCQFGCDPPPPEWDRFFQAARDQQDIPIIPGYHPDRWRP